MPPTGSDKALRRLVAELAETTSEDMAAVLGMLNPRQAATVRSLLAAYGGVTDVFEVEAEPAAINTAGLSAWLAARVLGHPMEGLDAYRMAPGAVEALRDVTKTLPGDLAAALPATGATRQEAVNARMRSLFGKGEAV